MFLTSFVINFIDCRSVNKTARNNAKLIAGRVSKRISAKFCQYLITVEKSENNKEKKLKNPDWLKSDSSIFKAGANPAAETISITEKTARCLKTKRRSSL